MKIEIISELTTHRPLYNMGMVAGVCYDSDTESEQANIKRALECIKHKHERVLEIPEICVKISGISAKSLREIYTHIGGLPTRLQASTRFIDYECFDYIIPHSVINTDGAKEIWNETIENIKRGITQLKNLNIPKEDYSGLLPLSYESKMVWKINLRCLINFFNQRLCSKAYWEVREFAHLLKKKLEDYDYEWKLISEQLFVPKCESIGFCPEKDGCGKKSPKHFSNGSSNEISSNVDSNESDSIVLEHIVFKNPTDISTFWIHEMVYLRDWKTFNEAVKISEDFGDGRWQIPCGSKDMYNFIATHFSKKCWKDFWVNENSIGPEYAVTAAKFLHPGEISSIKKNTPMGVVFVK